MSCSGVRAVPLPSVFTFRAVTVYSTVVPPGTGPPESFDLATSGRGWRIVMVHDAVAGGSAEPPRVARLSNRAVLIACRLFCVALIAAVVTRAVSTTSNRWSIAVALS